MGVAAAMRSQVTNSNGTIGVEDVADGASGVQDAGMTLSGALSTGRNACVATFKA